MRMAKWVGVLCVLGGLVVLSGCAGEAFDLKVQNETQRSRIASLESELQATRLKLEQAQRQVSSSGQQTGVEAETLRNKVAALEEDVAKKKALIASLNERLVTGGNALPVELSAKLEDLAKKYPLISYDAGRGMLKLNTDLLFEKGSDAVASSATDAIKSIADILNSQDAQKFDVIIAGHTDDVPVLRPETVAKHPTNWHLSAHRAIAVLNLMIGDKVAPTRLSIRAFGEFRPVEPNAAGNKGNAKNRRVEILVVPQGA
jgi:chemotaxis protein MotB